MIRLAIVLILILLVVLILRSKAKNQGLLSSNIYKKIIVLILIISLIFFLATSGRYLIPQIFSIIKFALPFITKLVGI